jgi:FkbM family methyltransferase
MADDCSVHNRCLAALLQTIPPHEAEFFLQIRDSGIMEGVPFIELRNGDVLFGNSNPDSTYYKDVFINHRRCFEDLGLRTEAFGAAFDAMISYWYENCDSIFLKKSDFIRKNAVVLDIGVRGGHFVVKAARLAGTGGLVVAIDATEFSEARTALHVQRNSLSNVVFVRAIVGDQDGKATEFHYGSPNEAFSGVYSETFNTKGETIVDRRFHAGVFQGEMTTIDSIVGRLNLGRCDLVSMQINGAEVLALDGMRGTIERFAPALYITAFQQPSQVGVNRDAAAMIGDILRPCGYELLFRQATDVVFVPSR